MALIHLVEGPVGAGKSTYATRLSKKQSAPRINLDDWMTTLFSPDRPAVGRMEWYLERKQRCVEQIWKLTRSVVESGSEIVLELGLIRKSDRMQFYSLVDDAGYILFLHVLDAPVNIRKERVRERNLLMGDTYSMEVPDEIFDVANAMWEPIDESEVVNYEVIHLST